MNTRIYTLEIKTILLNKNFDESNNAVAFAKKLQVLKVD
jgi:hypothetical protein